MPQLGESVAEGTIGKWLKSVGDVVALDEPLLEVITDKVNAEVPSPFAGILREILVQEGQNVPYGVEIAVIEETVGATAPKAGTATTKPAAHATTGAATAGAATPTAAATPPAAPTSPAVTTTEGRVPVMAVGDPDARMTPAVRLLMRKHGLSPVQIMGTGNAGRITRDDVMTFVDGGSTGGAATGRGAAAAAGSAAAPGAATPAAQAGVSPSVQPAQAPSLPSGGSRARTKFWFRTPRCAAESPPR